ncbi:diguanylate cyclase [Robbsia sp. KACC 23696]|uniref:sensor domain-containing protein n=1 Tax=Robbsia sp. KACC 23696 TaxID=3149231 RepID=UPI00325C23D5
MKKLQSRPNFSLGDYNQLQLLISAACHALGYSSAALYEQKSESLQIIDVLSSQSDVFVNKIASSLSATLKNPGIEKSNGALFEITFEDIDSQGGERRECKSLAAIIIDSVTKKKFWLIFSSQFNKTKNASKNTFLYLLPKIVLLLRSLFTKPRAHMIRVEEKPLDPRISLLQSAVLNARDAILITCAEPIDEPGPVIVYCNPAFTKTTGYEIDEVVGKNPRILQGPATDPTALAKLRDALEHWRPIEIELLNYRKDGTEFWVELSIVPVSDAYGWFTHWVSIQRDITDRKKHERDAITLLETLKDREVLEATLAERIKSERALYHAATHDHLTGLYNRSYFSEFLQNFLKKNEGKKIISGLILFMDLDDFKSINDKFGHAAGDVFLLQFVKRLLSCLPSGCVAARFAGDEFVVFVNNVSDSASARQIANKIILANSVPLGDNFHGKRISASIGGAFLSVNSTAEDVLNKADAAMYVSKRKNKGSFYIHDI